MNRNDSDGSLSLQGAVWDPATNGSRCRGRRRGEEEDSGLWWMGVSHSGDPAPPPCLSLLTGPGLPSQQGALPKKGKTLARSSEKYHCSALIQCSTHPLSPRIVRRVTGLLRPWARLSVHHRPWLRPAPAMAAACPGHRHTALPVDFRDRRVGKRRFSHNSRNRILILLPRMVGFLFD